MYRNESGYTSGSKIESKQLGYELPNRCSGFIDASPRSLYCTRISHTLATIAIGMLRLVVHESRHSSTLPWAKVEQATDGVIVCQ